MPQTSFKDQIRNMLSESCFPASRVQLSNKEKLLSMICKQEEDRVNKSLIRSLRSLYEPVSAQAKQELRSVLMSALARAEQPSFLLQTRNIFFSFGKKTFASTFALLLILSSTLLSFPSVPKASAAYLECSGIVFINNVQCTSHNLVRLLPGDEIRTEDGLATIFYSNLTLVRFDPATVATLDPHAFPQINLQKGAVWLHAPLPSGPFNVTTSIARLRIPQGAAGVSVEENFTQLYAATAAVEVQIEKSGGTELVSLAPSKKLTIRTNRSRTQIREFSFDEKNVDWVYANRVKDHQYYEVLGFKSSEELSITKLLDAHRAVVEGDFSEARELLTELANMTQDSLAARRYDADLAILRDIGEKSEQLRPLVEVIKKDIIAGMRSLEAVSAGVSGPALEKTSSLKKTVKISGEAKVL